MTQIKNLSYLVKVGMYK